MSLKARFSGNYRSKMGNTTFRYVVTGTKKELAAYAEAQGEYYREDEDGNALFFTTRYTGDNVDLIITNAGNVVVDNSTVAKMESIVGQSSGLIQMELAKLAAGHIMSNLLGVGSTPVAATPTSVQAAPKQEITPAATEASADDAAVAAMINELNELGVDAAVIEEHKAAGTLASLLEEAKLPA